ncbi:universal stress protein [Faunimonas sp. B44]|uniref:universal stress protein n=1 Tax=Faunimonas sp. B44 TaxID=3461493 RepID=UPI0040446E97
MVGIRTVGLIMPGAAAVAPALAACRAALGGAGGRVVGIMVTPSVVSYALPAEVSMPTFIEAQLQANDRTARRAEAELRRECEAGGLEFEWHCKDVADYRVSIHAGRMARTVDLVIVPQIGDEEAVGHHDIDEVVFEAGRPVLALPAGWSGPALARRVVVAWDGGREAARAAFDALPLLERAEAVRVVAVREADTSHGPKSTAADALTAALARHGVPAEAAAVEPGPSGITATLLDQAAAFGADLMVMGCYGHSRMREMILGGVTRDLLAKPPLPLLLSN